MPSDRLRAVKKKYKRLTETRPEQRTANNKDSCCGLDIKKRILAFGFLDLDMRLNISKSHCMRFGKRFDAPCSSIISKQGGVLEWVNTEHLSVFGCVFFKWQSF